MGSVGSALVGGLGLTAGGITGAAGLGGIPSGAVVLSGGSLMVTVPVSVGVSAGTVGNVVLAGTGVAGMYLFAPDGNSDGANGQVQEDISDAPDKVNYGSKQLGKKYGEHKKDYPDIKDYKDYKKMSDEIFVSPDKVIHDTSEREYYYIKGNDLLRIKENGDFVSLYPGANSQRVINAIKSGGTIWP